MGHLRKVTSTLILCFSASMIGQTKVSQSYGATPRYELNVQLNVVKHNLAITGTMQIPRSPTDAPVIHFDLAKVMGAPTVSQVLSDGRRVVLATSTEKAESSRNVRYVVKLGTDRKKVTTLEFTYNSIRDKGFVFSLTGPAFYADGNDVAWYPQLKDSRGIGTINFQVSEPLKVVATGDAVAGTEHKFVIAEPQHLAFAAGKYNVQEAVGGIPVTGYELRERPGFGSYIGKVQVILAMLQNMFGPFPHKGFSVVEVPRDEANSTGFDGASMEGIILIDSDDFDLPPSIPFFGHELSHQWWGNLVGLAGTRGNDILDESMAQFGCLMVVRQLLGEQAAVQLRRQGLAGYSNTPGSEGYFDIVGANLDHPLDSLPADTFVSHEIANTKGVVVLYQLSQLIGEERFMGSLRRITAEYAHEDISWEQFETAMQNAAKVDVRSFFKEWFGQAGGPTFDTEFAQDGDQVVVSVRQAAPFFDTPLRVRLEGVGCNQQVVTVDVHGLETKANASVPFKVMQITVDPDYQVLHWMPQFREESTALAGVTAAKFLENDGKHKEAGAAYGKVLAQLPAPDVWGAEFWAEYGLSTSSMIDGDWKGVKDHALRALEAPNSDPYSLPFVYLRLAQAGDQLKDDALRRWAAAAAVSRDAKLATPTNAGKIATNIQP